MGCIILVSPGVDCTKQYKNVLYQKTKPAQSCSKNSGMEINQGKITQFQINSKFLIIVFSLMVWKVRRSSKLNSAPYFTAPRYFNSN